MEQPTASSDTVEDYGTPQRLWAEDAASRKEPVEKKGRKRKSDEYISDVLSPRRKHQSPSPLISANSAYPDRNDLSIQSQTQTKKSQPASNGGISPPAKHGEREASLSRPARPHTVIADSDDNDDTDNLFEWIEEEDDPILCDNDALYPVLPTVSSVSDTEMAEPSKRSKKDSAPSLPSVSALPRSDPGPASASNDRVHTSDQQASQRPAHPIHLALKLGIKPSSSFSNSLLAHLITYYQVSRIPSQRIRKSSTNELCEVSQLLS